MPLILTTVRPKGMDGHDALSDPAPVPQSLE